MNMTGFSSSDLAQIEELGLTVAAIEDQLATYAKPPAKLRLTRPCTPGDGIRILNEAEQEDLRSSWGEAVSAGRVSKFIPASGAATRMFAGARWLLAHPDLWDEAALAAAAESDVEARGALELLDALPALPLWDELERYAPTDDAVSSIPALLQALVVEPGFAEYPKALLPFHRYEDGSRTALEEHLFAAVEYLCNEEARECTVHVTTAPRERERFERFLAERVGAVQEATGATIRTDLSTQAHSTDVVAMTPDGEPARTRDGRLLFRPSGHGALLRNLAAAGGDLVVIENVDNVGRAPHDATARSKRTLIGLAARLQDEVHLHESRLAGARDPQSPAVRAAADFLAETFGLRPPVSLGGLGADGLFEWTRTQLHRPLRVCGMVRNEGEPGGGPFWVTDRRGQVSPQIVERAQVDRDDSGQLEIWRSSTHFNPVDIVCAMLDSHGRGHDLERFADPDTGFFVEKVEDGRAIVSFERPGLWNGAMAEWNTVFVEVPSETFTPVKTARDLLRPEHDG